MNNALALHQHRCDRGLATWLHVSKRSRGEGEKSRSAFVGRLENDTHILGEHTCDVNPPRVCYAITDTAAAGGRWPGRVPLLGARGGVAGPGA